MGTEFLCLLCLGMPGYLPGAEQDGDPKKCVAVGLSLGYGDEEKNETFPRPSLSCWPSSVVERKSNVTLRCRTHFQNVTVMLGKLQDSGFQQEQSSAGNEAEFPFIDLQPKDAGEYFCAYKTAASEWSEESQRLQLVVTGSLPEPMLSVNVSTTTSGFRILLCQIPHNGTECFIIALLKAGIPEPLQTKKVNKNQTDFTVWNVTSKDSGTYSCIYYQCNWPYLASSRSQSLGIWVSDEYNGPGVPSQKTDSRLIFPTTFSCLCIFLLFLSIFLIYRCTQHDSAQEDLPRDPQGVNYAELDTHIPSEVTFVPAEQPSESCDCAALEV